MTKKLGLIKMASKSARSELLRANEEREQAKKAELMGSVLASQLYVNGKQRTLNSYGKSLGV